jgi:hypothetical protein
MVTVTAEPSDLPLDATVRRAGYGDVRFNLADTLEMVRATVIPEDVSIELLNGRLVYRDRFDIKDGVVVFGPRHRYVVCKLADLSIGINDGHRHLSSQCQLTCSDWHAPIADAVVLRGSIADFDGLPTAADAFCVVEVADSSYERDAGEKLFGYARAGVPQYVIVNLRNRTAEVYAGPDVAAGTYPPPTIVPADGVLSLRVADGELFDVPLADLLP